MIILRVRAALALTALGLTIASFSLAQAASVRRSVSIAVRPSASGTYAIIHSFGYGDGLGPVGGVTFVNGNLYGTTVGGGPTDQGTIFEMMPGGAERVVYSFEGAQPAGDLLAVNGVLYGTSSDGGQSDNGFVFSYNPDLGERNVHVFLNRCDGARPSGPLIEARGMLLGTENNENNGPVRSAAYSIDRTAAVKATAVPLQPSGALVELEGTLYGVSAAGGSANYGAIFAISPSGSVSILHSFNASADPRCLHDCDPVGLMAFNGKLYGEYSYHIDAPDSNYVAMAVYELSPSGSFKVLHAFPNVGDPEYPCCPLTAYNGRLYGVSGGGGSYGLGSVFELDTAGNAAVLHSFGSDPYDGTYPEGRLIAYNGMLYGTTWWGGAVLSFGGTVYTISP